MPLPFVVGIWSPTMRDAVKFVSDLYLGDSLVQVAPNGPNGFWILLRVTGDQERSLREMGRRATPRWSFLI